MNEDFYYNDSPDSFEKMPEALKTGLAIASFVTAMVNFVIFGFTLTFILAPISIITGALSLKRKQGGKGFAIAGITVSVVGVIINIIFISVFIKVYPDMEYFIKNDYSIISEFEESGEIPEQFEKYRSSKYDSYWKSAGCKDFDEFFAIFIDIYMKTQGLYTSPSNPDSPAFPPDNDGEELVELSFRI